MEPLNKQVCVAVLDTGVDELSVALDSLHGADEGLLITSDRGRLPALAGLAKGAFAKNGSVQRMVLACNRLHGRGHAKRTALKLSQSTWTVLVDGRAGIELDREVFTDAEGLKALYLGKQKEWSGPLDIAKEAKAGVLALTKDAPTLHVMIHEDLDADTAPEDVELMLRLLEEDVNAVDVRQAPVFCEAAPLSMRGRAWATMKHADLFVSDDEKKWLEACKAKHEDDGVSLIPRTMLEADIIVEYIRG